MARILIIEDDLRLATFTQMTLEAKGYVTELALTGEAGQRCLLAQPVDLILLDLDLPDISGLALCQRLREQTSVPIVIFSAEGHVPTKVTALEAGANDYIVKPIDTRELLARVQAQLQAVLRQQGLSEQKLGQLLYAPDKELFMTPCGRLVLSETGHQVLRALFQKAGQVMTKHELYTQAWQGDYVPERDSHLIEVQISRLRKQLKASDSGCQILSAYGKGYYLVAPVQPENLPTPLNNSSSTV